MNWPIKTLLFTGNPWVFAPGTTNIEPPINVFTIKSPPLLKSSKEVKAASNALFKPSSSPGSAPIVNQLSYSSSGNIGKNIGLIGPPKSPPNTLL